MDDEWRTIVEFMPVREADAQWRAWLDTNSDSLDIPPEAVRIDTGMGRSPEGRKFDIRRYRVRATAMPPATKTKHGDTEARRPE